MRVKAPQRYARLPWRRGGWFTQEGWAWLVCGLLYALVMVAIGVSARC